MEAIDWNAYLTYLLDTWTGRATVNLAILTLATLAAAIAADKRAEKYCEKCFRKCHWCE